MKIENRARTASVIGLIIIAWLVGSSFVETNTRIKTIVKKEKHIIFREKRDDFSEQKLKEYILELNLKYPEVILAQAKLESGNFTSRAFREQNNLFGLHVAKQRPTLAKRGRGKLAHYSSWRDSVVDYAFLVADRMRKLHTREAYFAYLDENYDVAGYSKKLLKFI